MKEDEEERQRLELEAHEKAVRDFELLQMGLEIKNARSGTQQKIVGREDGKFVLEETVKEDAAEKPKGTKRKFELDEEELRRIANEETQKAKTAITAAKVRHRNPQGCGYSY